MKNRGRRIAMGLMLGVLTLGAAGCQNTGSMATEETGTVETTQAVEEASEEMTDKPQEKDVVSKKTIDRLENIEELIEEHFIFEVDEQAKQEGIIRGYVESLGDPYSVYYTAEEYAESKKYMDGEIEWAGVPILFSYDAVDPDMVIVWKVYGLAKEAGIKAQDALVKINGEDIASLDAYTIEEKLRGEEGSEVTLTIYRFSDEKEYDFTIRREKIEIPTIEYKLLENQIGYVQIISFVDGTEWQYIRAIQDLNSLGMESLIVDVRQNGGGTVQVAVEMLDYMLPEGKIAYTEDKYGNVINTYYSAGGSPFEKPLVVLTDGNTASSAEIFAGAIKDYGIGTILGETTYGKGITQRMFQFADGSAMKLTASKWFTPNGNNIHLVGIEPDVEVELDVEMYRKSEGEKDNQLQAAIDLLSRQTN